jgi:Ca-activated chloride channel family protein
MKRSQLIIAVVAVAVVAIFAVVQAGGGGGGDGDGGSKGSSGSKAPSGALKVSFAYSPEKEKLLAPLIKKFNQRGEEVGGKAVFIEGSIQASGEAERKIAQGKLEPVAWSPSSSLWGRQLNFDADQPFAPEDNPSIVRTPLVIAMWEPLAQALGYPKKEIGYSDILKLAQSGKGWAAYGKPEFGAFKLVHTNPDFSTSGLEAVVGEYYAATGKKEGLLLDDVNDKRSRATVKGIERSIVHYGDTTLFIANQMRKNGPGYASAVAMEEVTLLDFNRDRGSQPKLVAVYPKEGTFYSDNPFIVLDAPWVSADQRKGAEAFQKFLAEEIDADAAGAEGFRPADLKAKPAGRVTAANGANPAEPKRVLGLPEPRVLARIKENWREDRKPANVLLVFDTSGSMNEEGRLPNAKRGVEAFLKEVSPNDRVGLMTFSDQIKPLLPIRPIREGRAKLSSTVKDLFADGGTALYDATIEGVRRVEKLKDEEHINAVVVLTDGEDTDSSASVSEVVQEVDRGDSESRVRVFTIAYGSAVGGSEESLAEIAEAAGGMSYTGDTDDIEAVYKSISSFF